MKNNVLHALMSLTIGLTALTQIGCSAKVENDPEPKLFDYTNENPTKPLDLTFSTEANPINNTFTITNTANDLYDVRFDFTAPSTQQYAIYSASIVYSGCDASLPKSTEYLANNDGNGNLDIIPTDLKKPFELTGGQKYSFLIHLENIKSCSLLQYSFALVERGVVSKPVPTPVPSRQKATSLSSTRFISCEDQRAQIEIDLGTCNLDYNNSCNDKTTIKYKIKSTGAFAEFSSWMNISQSGGSSSYSWDASGNIFVSVSTYYFTEKEAHLETSYSNIDSIPCEFYQ